MQVAINIQCNYVYVDNIEGQLSVFHVVKWLHIIIPLYKGIQKLNSFYLAMSMGSPEDVSPPFTAAEHTVVLLENGTHLSTALSGCRSTS